MRHAQSFTPRRSAVRVLPILAVCLALVTAGPVAAKPPAAADPAVITFWNEVAVTTVSAPASPTNFHYFAFTHIAIYNAVVGITGEYELYGGTRKRRRARRQRQPPPPPRTAYFATTSARRRRPNLDAQLAASLALVPDGVPKDQGIRYGVRAADRIIALRANDGRGAAVAVPPAEWHRRLATDAAGVRAPSPPPGSAGSRRSPWIRSTGSIPARRRRSARRPTSTNSRRCATTGDINAPLAVRSFEHDTDGEVLLRCGHHRDAAWAAGLCPAARARHRRQRPHVRGGRHGHRGRGRHGMEREAPVHVVATGHRDPGADSRPNVDAVGSLAAMPLITTPPYPDWPSGLCSVVGAASTVLTTPQR